MNKTNLQGTFDFTLHWTPNTSTGTSDSDAPSLFTALQEQLGLKLIAEKAPGQFLVIDQIENPSAN